jgi:hypothetical protein
MTHLTEYRRRPRRDAWHFSRRCPWWPHVRGTIVRRMPGRKRPTGELCNHCRAAEREGRT